MRILRRAVRCMRLFSPAELFFFGFLCRLEESGVACACGAATSFSRAARHGAGVRGRENRKRHCACQKRER